MEGFLVMVIVKVKGLKSQRVKESKFLSVFPIIILQHKSPCTIAQALTYLFCPKDWDYPLMRSFLWVDIPIYDY